MTTSRPASLRPVGAVTALLVSLLLALAACASVEPTPPASPSPAATSPPPPTPLPTPRPTPSPEPTPRFTNPPDAELAALIPTEANGIPIVVAPFDEFALTPGDVGLAYGELGTRFASLVVAYVEQPRTTLYALRVDGEPVTTEELEPHLATAGRYVGINGLEREPWELGVAGGHRVWMRPEDNATAAGTVIYTWASGEHVFLLIGVDDALNRGIVEALPGEAPPTPTPAPTASPGGTEPPGPPPTGSPSDG